MKKAIMIFLTLALGLGCLTGCSRKVTAATMATPEVPSTPQSSLPEMPAAAVEYSTAADCLRREICSGNDECAGEKSCIHNGNCPWDGACDNREDCPVSQEKDCANYGNSSGHHRSGHHGNHH